jgi:peptide/histidine transporter 3/4
MNSMLREQYSAWNGACYVTPLLGGYVADSFLGRAPTILIFSCIYLAGLAMIVAGSAPTVISEALVFTSIYTIALGTGGIKPNVSTLGADQFDDKYPRDREEKLSFFNWYEILQFEIRLNNWLRC